VGFKDNTMRETKPRHLECGGDQEGKEINGHGAGNEAASLL
jgi:hypothetical protein